MSEWKEYKLGDCVEMQKGFAFKSSDYINHGIKIIKVSNLNQKRFDDDSCVFISPILAEQYSRYSLSEDDIIISTVGSWPSNPESVVGKVCRVPKIINGSLLNQNAVRLRVKKHFNQRFIYYILSSSNFSSYIANTAQGSANQASITLDDIRSYKFISPDIKGQEGIVSILNSLDDKIAVNKKICENLEAQAQALFKHWFVDFAPFKDGKFVESELGLIPEGWRVGTLGEIAEFKRGKTITKSDVKEGLIPVVAGGLEPAYYHNQSNTSSRVITISGSGANAGFTRMYYQSVWASDCSFTDNSSTSFLHTAYCYLITNKKNVDALQWGAAQPHVYAKDINKLPLAIPPLDVLNQFEELIAGMFDLIEINDKEIIRLATLRDTLLPKLMSGQIKL